MHAHKTDTPMQVLFNMGASLFSAATVQVVAIFFFVMLFLLSGAVYSVVFEPKELGLDDVETSGLINGLGSLLAATCFIGAYIAPFVLICIGSLGVPAALAGWRLGLIRQWNCILAGFFLGSVPGGLFLYNTYSGGSSSANGVDYWINGVPTFAGMIQLMIVVLIMGFLGALGGYSFWIVWRFLTRSTSNQPD